MKSEWNIYCKEKLKSFQIKAIIEPKWRAQLELWILSSLKAVLWITSVQSINSVLWVFLGLKFGNDAIQLSLCFTLWKIAHVIILRGNFHQPVKKGKACYWYSNFKMHLTEILQLKETKVIHYFQLILQLRLKFTHMHTHLKQQCHPEQVSKCKAGSTHTSLTKCSCLAMCPLQTLAAASVPAMVTHRARAAPSCQSPSATEVYANITCVRV